MKEALFFFIEKWFRPKDRSCLCGLLELHYLKVKMINFINLKEKSKQAGKTELFDYNFKKYMLRGGSKC